MINRFFEVVISLYSLGLLLYVILSWFKPSPADVVSKHLGRIYEPLLTKIRFRIQPVKMNGQFFDFSPLLLLIGLLILKQIIRLILPSGW